MKKQNKTIKKLRFYDGVKEGWEEELWKLLEDGVLRSASCEPNEDIDESEFEQFFAGTRVFIKKLFQRFIEETRIPEIKLVMDENCPFCGKKKWECEAELAIDKEIEFEELNGFNCHRITHNQVVRKLNQKQAKWLEENL